MLEQLTARAQADSCRLVVLSFARQRQSVPVDRAVEFHCAEPKQIKISQPGSVVPFRADLFLSLGAIKSEGIAEEVVVELGGNSELPCARDSLIRVFPGGINLGSIARLTRSIIMLKAADLPGAFWTKEAAGEPNGVDLGAEEAGSRAHSLARSIECADTVVLSDSMTSEPAELEPAMRLLRALNPTLAIVDLRLLRLDSIPVTGSVHEHLQKPLTERIVSHSAARWVISDDDFARLTLRASRPLHPQRFQEFMNGGWRGVLRTRGEVLIASQPGTRRFWSQTGQVGVLGSKTPFASSEWGQDMTMVGSRKACLDACCRFDACFLTDEEMELGPRLWRAFNDPLQD